MTTFLDFIKTLIPRLEPQHVLDEAYLAQSVDLQDLERRQTTFPTPEAVANAFIDAVATNDDVAKREILGADYRRFIPKEAIEADDRTAFLYASSKGRKMIADSPEMAHLAVGTEGWTLPVPIVKSAQGWSFDVKAGAEEMRIRRIGRNELAAMQALLAYHDAQKDYALLDHNGDCVLEYAQRVRSTPGKRDGLFWPNDPASPLGPLYGDETKDGIYYGYRFRIQRGVKVEFVVHPVAGRMPGHMNVLLAEANVPYELLREMDDINGEMDKVDVCIVLGANDVVNPVAETDTKSAIAGMPIIQAHKAKTVIVVKRSLSPGFAGIPNPLFARENALMFFSDGKKAIQDIINAVKEGA